MPQRIHPPVESLNSFKQTRLLPNLIVLPLSTEFRGFWHDRKESIVLYCSPVKVDFTNVASPVLGGIKKGNSPDLSQNAAGYGHITAEVNKLYVALIRLSVSLDNLGAIPAPVHGRSTDHSDCKKEETIWDILFMAPWIESLLKWNERRFDLLLQASGLSRQWLDPPTTRHFRQYLGQVTRDQCVTGRSRSKRRSFHLRLAPEWVYLLSRINQ